MLTKSRSAQGWRVATYVLRPVVPICVLTLLLLGDLRFSNAQTSPLTIQPSTSRVGVNTTNPAYPLDVNGTVNATAFRGDGSQLTNLPSGGGSAVGAFGSRGQTSRNNPTTPNTQYDLKADAVILYKPSDQTTPS